MKHNLTFILAASLICFSAAAQSADKTPFGKVKESQPELLADPALTPDVATTPEEQPAPKKKDIVKTGLNIGPLPAVAFDADKGFQLGAVLQLFDYGDGSNYPNYNSKTYLEYSHFTKGSNLFQLRYDNKTLIPNARWSSALRVNLDKAFDFYGFNGYESYYNAARIAEGKAGSSYLFSPFYRFQKNEFLFKSEIIGNITDNFQWQAGIFANYFKLGTIDYANVNKGKEESAMFPSTMPTLYELYYKAGVISEAEFNGGLNAGLRFGLVYDSRDKEGAPSRGIWADAHVIAAPKFLSNNETRYYRYSITWRHYLPLVKNDVLTFAYRLNYEGNFGKDAPFYALPYMSVMGEKCDLEGMGGYNTVRGLMRTRVIGLDMATYNAEFRWRFVRFNFAKQNIALALSAFSDGTMVTKDYDISALSKTTAHQVLNKNVSKDSMHVTFGAGFRFIMNENFIVAFEYGSPLSRWQKNSPVYNQDGAGAFYINIGYLF